MNKPANIYKEVVSITEDYLGPAAERFVSRQLETHLAKKPQALEKKDLDKVSEWLRLSLAFLTDDKKMLDEYLRRLHELRTRANGTSLHASQK